ncbi:DUF4442 domain-containing protein [Flavihumibacter stibioxidans]|uniref:Thioesterase n=1 Tax=Flavihumibacter stibioxidans TaxID=1834163 RepID=A0ABR7MD03_9BACT|nr:DUF4442 domain-containing protein [Flavihumibacter stibioxidans]MBC6492905.1 thioesterase [Flavihumibacter stibioxidans]
MESTSKTFFSLAKHPLRFRLFLLAKLPSAYFAGVRVLQAGEESCSVSVPYKWFSKNPFRSTYFACLAMAAEMSTGVLSMAHVFKRKPAVSMLVTGLEAKYFKKATGITVFTCNDGLVIRGAIDEAVSTGNGQTLTTRSVGKNDQGDIVAEFLITWSYKPKTL